ncbi:ANTAR domain-containing protein [Vreelandella alkaliphila]|uniref:ANTAR domain-containing protein n=1 Tax=Vreelandella alkaliphila TaxID=272774 RepID=UPI003FD70C88
MSDLITTEVRESVERSVLCWLATSDENGQPNVSPKEVFAVADSQNIVVANIASPRSAKNIRANLWPLPETLDFPVDIIFSGVFQDSSHARLKKIIRDSTDAVTLIFIVEYASPSTLSQLLEIESHGVVTVPLKSHDVLPSLVVARRNSEDLLKSRKEINKAHNKLSSMSLLNKAKVILMKNTPMTEEEAHQFLSKSAMEERKSIAEIAEIIIDKSE